MTTRKMLCALFVVAVAAVLGVSLPRTQARSAKSAAVVPPIVNGNAIGGVVTSAKGPEAGVWVIAETNDLPTKFVRIVVTDDHGRYVVPDLPKANYNVWVRGYGLVDSKPVQTTPGKAVNLGAVVAPSPLAAAQYYPADYWYSLIQVPPKSAFPMTKEGIETQAQWIDAMKNSLQGTQVGDKATREIPEQLGKFQSSTEAWEAWMKTGESPVAGGRLNKEIALKMYADWTDRIAAGELPPAPPRPEGVERNLVITEWDWSDDKGFLHDDIATDKRDPRINANGPIYGLEQFSNDIIDVLEPLHGTTSRIQVPVRDADLPTAPGRFPLTWGEETVRKGRASLHNPMMDQKGRIWLTAQIRSKAAQPAFCKQGSDLPSAKFFPLDRNFTPGDPQGREVEVYDPETRQFTMIDTCFGTMHLEFADDPDDTLWFSGGDLQVGWINTKMFDETHDEAKSQGWCPYILDTNGNGKLDPGWVEAEEPVDTTKDKRIKIRGSYGIAVNPIDGSIWQSSFDFPGAIYRTAPGSNPPFTCITEVYNAPAGAYRPKGIDVDRSTGLVWVTFATSGHFASFDRRKCRVRNGPTATGNHCPEGWTLYPTPGPKFKGVTDQINTDWHYLGWVDQFDTLGLGKNIPMAPGTNSDATLALLPNGKYVVLRVPYPLGYYTRGVDGRIDDPNGGWKGRGLWSTYATIRPWNIEGGKGERAKVVKLQLRPNPLAD